MARSNPWDYRYAIARTQAKTVSGITATPEILLARESFDAFCEFINPKWKPEEFHRRWTPLWDTNESNDVLKKIAGTNSVVLAPRGGAKSTRLGLFAAYAIGHNPDIQIIYTSYSESVSLSRSILIKRIVSSLRYQQVFPWIAPGSRWADTVWEVNKARAGIEDIESDYTFFAAGITGSITSRRCLVHDTMIITEKGEMPISELSSHIGIRIASYDHRTQSIEWNRLTAVASRHTNRLARVRTSGGNTLTSTPCHPIYIDQQGYRAAGSLVPGNTIVSIAEDNGRQGLSCLQQETTEEKQWTSVFGLLSQIPNLSFHSVLPTMQQAISRAALNSQASTHRKENEDVLLSGLLQCSKGNTSVLPEMQCTGFCIHQKKRGVCQEVLRCLPNPEKENSIHAGEEGVYALWYFIPAEGSAQDVLLPGLPERGPFLEDAGGRQQSLQEGYEPLQNIPGFAPIHPETRQESMPGVQLQRRPSGSSYRSRLDEQFTEKSNDSLFIVPCKTSSKYNAWKRDTIESVECFDESTIVYDIEVEAAHNFFANGLLVHNSSLILYDDLIKNSSSIASPETREKIITNIQEAIQPTLIPGGREMAVGTLFRPDDAYATILTAENGYDVHRQAAIETDLYGQERSYWPSRFTLESLQEIRRKNPSVFEYQYQNRIAPVTGIAIDNAWMPRKELICPIHEFDLLVIGGDLASKEKEQSDDTVFILGGRKGRQFQVIDYRSGKWGGNISKLLEIFELCIDWDILTIDPTQKPSDFKSYSDFRKGRTYRSTDVAVKVCMEDVAYQASLAGDFRDYVIHEKEIYTFVYRGMPSRADKLSRLQGVTGVMENGLVSFNKYVNFDYVINQLRNFGSWDSDDAVDAFEKMMKGLIGYGNVTMED